MTNVTPGLDQPPREQHAGAEEVAAVAVAELQRFRDRSNAVFAFGEQQQVERGIAADGVAAALDCGGLRVELLDQRAPRVQRVERESAVELRQARFAAAA